MSKSELPQARWAVHHADASASERARGALLAGGQVVSVLGGPERTQVPGAEVQSIGALLADADLLIAGHPGAAEVAIAALEQGLHVSVEVPLMMEPRAFLSLAHAAKAAGRILHLFDPTLYVPAFRTLLGHARPSVVTSIAATADTPGEVYSEPIELLRRHLCTLHRVLLLGGPVERILSHRWESGTLEAALRFRTGSMVAITLSSGGREHFELDVQAQLRWRIEGSNLFAGPSMATLTDTRRPAELGMWELTRLHAGTGTPTLSETAHYHALQVCQALAAGTTGSIA